MHFFVAITVSSQVVSSGKYETPKRVLPGMYIYADGLIYPEIIGGTSGYGDCRQRRRF